MLRRAGIVSLFTVLVGIGVMAQHPPPQATVTPPFPAATGTRYPTSKATARPDLGGAKFVTAKQLTREQMEQFLLNAKILSEKPVEKGITHTMRVTMSDGRIYHDAHVQQIDVYKAEYRTKDSVEKNFTDSYKYNVAAYRLDKMLELNNIPVCVYRLVDGKPSAVDWWVDDVQFDEEGRRDKNIEPPDLNGWGRQLNDIRDFDQLIYNVDRNQGNILIDRDWRVWAIDHSRSFRTATTLRDTSILRRISGKLLQNLKNLRQPDLEANLTPFISREAIQAVMARRDLLVKFFENQVNEKGADVVLTDIPRHTERVTIP